MLTEDEAKTKWCPFARDTIGRSHPLPVGNRWGPDWSKCIASACMAWRPTETAEFKIKADDAFRKYGTRLVADTGFCGLAGKPS